MTERRQFVDEAEARKFDAEAEEARARIEVTKADVEKARAEARKLLAEAEQTEIKLANERREYNEKMTGDKYHHIYFFTKDVNGESVRTCMSQLKEWRRLDAGNESKADIEIVFSSPGGSVIDGMALYDYIQAMRRDGHHVTTSTIGYAASMAGILLQAGDNRVMGRESYLLIHEISFGAGGKIGEVEDEVAFIKKIQKRVLNIFAERSRQAFEAGTAEKATTVAQIDKGWKRKDWWLSSDEALKLGFVDEIR